MFNEDRLSKGDRVRDSAPTQQVKTAWEETLDIKEPAPERDAMKVIPNLRKAST